MTPPDFIIAGAMRSGTTALAEALAEHPHLFMTEPKEPSYFTYRHGGSSFSGPGDQWFAKQNVGDWARYQALFRPGDGQLAGEASAMYLAVPESIPDIAAACPDTRIVLVLRDPVQRALSAWLYLRSQGREDVEDVEAALAEEPARRAAGFGPMWWYTEASRYDVGLARIRESFSDSRILVLLTEQLRAEPAAAIEATCSFLGIPSSPRVLAALGREVNRGGVPKSGGVTRLLYPPDRIRGALSSAAPAWVRNGVRRLRSSSLTPSPPMPDAVRRQLDAELCDVGPEVARLSGADTARWWSAGRESRSDHSMGA